MPANYKGEYKMSKNRRRRSRRRKASRRASGQTISVLSICAVVILLIVMVSVSSVTLQAKDKSLAAQETELKEQIETEKTRSEEIDELEDYVGTDEYIESVAKEKLGLVHEGEIVFKSE